jgi:hypothetical protein
MLPIIDAALDQYLRPLLASAERKALVNRETPSFHRGKQTIWPAFYRGSWRGGRPLVLISTPVGDAGRPFQS